MTIKQLIEQLKEYPENTIVMAYDADSEQMEDITGFLFCPRQNHETEGIVDILEICTDTQEG
jgi:hypothetical protein